MLEHLAREPFVVGNAAFAHQSGVGGETFDMRMAVEFQNAIQISTVGKNFYYQLIKCFHYYPFKIISARNEVSSTVKSAGSPSYVSA